MIIINENFNLLIKIDNKNILSERLIVSYQGISRYFKTKQLKNQFFRITEFCNQSTKGILILDKLYNKIFFVGIEDAKQSRMNVIGLLSMKKSIIELHYISDFHYLSSIKKKKKNDINHERI